MDYEKKYKNALTIAQSRFKIEKDESVLTCLGMMFPELRESEDERIRKKIVDIVKVSPFDEEKDVLLDWLEKRKEQEHICDSAQFEDGFKTGLEIGLRKQKEQKPAWSEEDEEMLDAMIDIVSNSLYEPLCPREEMLAWLKSIKDSILRP